MTQDDIPSRVAVDLTGATLLANYRVERKIADGGMGSVWLGEDTNLGRKVVVKVPHVRFLGEPGFRVRFVREISELVRLEHPNIVRILAQGTHEEIPFFVLQYLGGGSLEERREGGGPRGVGARWEVTVAQDHIEGIRVTQTTTYELESFDEREAQLRLYIAVTALDQTVEHPRIPAGATVRLKRVHGDGSGRTVIDFDRVVPRSTLFVVESRAEMSIHDEGKQHELVVGRELRIDTRRD